jgi:hypothetical protein
MAEQFPTPAEEGDWIDTTSHVVIGERCAERRIPEGPVAELVGSDIEIGSGDGAVARGASIVGPHGRHSHLEGQIEVLGPELHGTRFVLRTGFSTSRVQKRMAELEPVGENPGGIGVDRQGGLRVGRQGQGGMWSDGGVDPGEGTGVEKVRDGLATAPVAQHPVDDEKPASVELRRPETSRDDDEAHAPDRLIAGSSEYPGRQQMER